MQIVFVHLQKTAGTALFSLLSEHFDSSAVFWGPTPPLADPSKHIVGSHLPYRDHAWGDPRERLVITSIRDPAERVASLYRYWRSMRWELVARNPWPQIAAAKRMGFVEWLRDPEVVEMIDNGMVAHFCDDPAAAPEVRLEQAKANLAKCDFIFASQTLSEDLQDFLGALSLDCASPKIINSTDGNAEDHPANFEKVEPIEFTDEVFTALAERTGLDRLFYDHALEIRGGINARVKQKVAHTRPKTKLRRLVNGMNLLARGLRQDPTVLGVGWGAIEDWHVWSVQPAANFFIEVSPEVRSCELKLQAHLPGGQEILRTRITVNDAISMDVMFVGSGSIYHFNERRVGGPLLICSGTAPVLVQIPVDVGRRADGRVDVRFEMDDLLSPALLGLNEDTRRLGVALYSLRCSSAPAAGHEDWTPVGEVR